MHECELRHTCAFYREIPDESDVNWNLIDCLKRAYCSSHNSIRCARALVGNVLGPDRVPSTLFPNQTEHARILITL